MHSKKDLKKRKEPKGIGWDFILILYFYQKSLKQEQFIPAKKLYDLFTRSIHHNLEKLTEADILILKIKKGVSTKEGFSRKYYSLNPANMKRIEKYISDNLQYIEPFIGKRLARILIEFKGKVLDEKIILKIIERLKKEI